MLYTNKQLASKGFDHRIAVKRYLYKYLNQKKEFKRLKPHEKDYLFGWMRVSYNEQGKPAFDLYEETEAQEYIFFNIVLTYGEDIDKFEGPIMGPHGKLMDEEIRKDHAFFDKYLSIWKKQIEERNGPYLSIIAPMLYQKLKELKSVCSSEDEYNSRERYCYGIFFYIYYKSKLLFEENNKRCLIFKIKEFDFVINIYTFCHIFTRHYVPSLNKGLSVSMNSKIPYIDVNNFVETLKGLIVLYFNEDDSLDIAKEYMLFKFMNDPYILWIKYKRMNELSKNMGFEVRSFYKCEEEADISKFDGKKEIILSKGCFCYI